MNHFLVFSATKLYIVTPRKLMERNDNPEKQLLKLNIIKYTIEENKKGCKPKFKFVQAIGVS